MTEPSLEQKLEKMQQIFRDLETVVVAFSAGVDSTFLLKVAVDTLGPENVVAVTSASESLAQSEYDEAIELTREMGVEHVFIDTREFDDPNFVANPSNRCYHCRTELFTHLDQFVSERGYKAVVCGINADDYEDWRPGIQAAREHNVGAPCAEAGLTKQEIRVLSKQMNLPTFDKPAMPCLSSRVQYGEEVTPEKMRQIEQAEVCLHELGFRECRVRHHNNLARIEVPPADIERIADLDTRTKIDDAFRKIGYNYVTLDLRGFRSGSMNEVIAFGKRQGT